VQLRPTDQSSARAGAQIREGSARVLQAFLSDLSCEPEYFRRLTELHDDAERLIDQAMALYRAVPDGTESTLSQLHIQSSLIAFRKQDYVKAVTQAEEAVAVARRARTGMNLQTELANSLENLGFILTNTDKPVQAEPLLRESLAIKKATNPKGHPDIADVMSLLGDCLTKQRRYREAEAFLIEGDEDLSSTMVEQNPRRVDSRQRLVRLYEAWGKPDLAARYR